MPCSQAIIPTHNSLRIGLVRHGATSFSGWLGGGEREGKKVKKEMKDQEMKGCRVGQKEEGVGEKKV